MTFRSIIIEAYAHRESATSPYVAGADCVRLGSLNGYTWPSSAVAFAREHDLVVDYVDNCWVRVAMSAEMLRAFLELGTRTDPDVLDLRARVEDELWYVVNEEEF